MVDNGLRNVSVGSPDYLFSDSTEFKFSPGKRISGFEGASDRICFIKSGKIRILKPSDEGDYTVSFINEGELWDFTVDDYKYLASEATVIFEILLDEVLKREDLKRAYDFYLNKLDELRNTNNQREKVPFLNNEGFESTSTGLSGSFNPSDILDALFEYYKFPNKNHNCPIESLEDLRSLLKDLDFRAVSRKVEWKQLLNTNFPFVLENKDGGLIWITGRKGNALIEGLTNERFLPEDVSPNEKLNLLKIERAPRSDVVEQEEPFSTLWYMNLYKRNADITLQMVIASFLIQLFALGMPIFYIVIFDRVFGRQNISALDVMSVGMIMILTFDIAVKSVRSFVLANFLENIDKLSFKSFLKRIFALPLDTVSGDIKNHIEKFAEISKINYAYAYTTLLSSLDLGLSLIMVVILFMLNVKLAFISLSPIIPIALIVFFIMPMQKARLMQSGKNQRNSQIKLQEAVSNIETVKSVSAEWTMMNSIGKNVNEYVEKDFMSRFSNISGGNLLGTVGSLGYLATLYFGAYEVLMGHTTYGVYLAISMMGRNFIGSFQRMLTSFQLFQETMPLRQELKNLYTIALPSEDEGRGIFLRNIKGDIEFSDVYFRYSQDSNFILNNVNLSIKQGEKIVLTGKSGSGKSTLIRLLQGLYKPVSGEISIDGYNIQTIDHELLRYSVGTVIQRPAIFSGTIKENIMLSTPDSSMENLLNAVSLAKLDSFISKLPNGLNTNLISGGLNISGGQAAKIALARVLITNPDILIIDETLNTLDFNEQMSIFKYLLERYKHKTCIFVTDFLPAHQWSDRIVVLNEGFVAEEGKYSDLISSKGYYYHLYSIQQGVYK